MKDTKFQKNTTKIGVSGHADEGWRMGIATKKLRQGIRSNMSGNLVPKNLEFGYASCWTGFPCLKCSVLQREAFFWPKRALQGPNPLPTAYIYIYIYISFWPQPVLWSIFFAENCIFPSYITKWLQKGKKNLLPLFGGCVFGCPKHGGKRRWALLCISLVVKTCTFSSKKVCAACFDQRSPKQGIC